jgi:hypothetical protein
LSSTMPCTNRKGFNLERPCSATKATSGPEGLESLSFYELITGKMIGQQMNELCFVCAKSQKI